MPNNNDENTDLESSPGSAEKGESSQDVNKGDDSSSSQSDHGSNEKGFDETLSDEYKRLTKDDSKPSTGENEEEGNVQELNNTDDSKEETEAKEEEGQQEEGGDQEESTTEEDKGPVPYDRFSEVNEERNTLRSELEQIRPLAEAHKTVRTYCDTNGITRDEFVEAVELAVLLKKNPTEFGKKMSAVLEGIGVLTGEKLPPDIQEKVDKDLIDIDSAKELARLRAGSQHIQKTQELTAKQQEAQRQQKFVGDLHQAWSNWGSDIQKKYPDFKPKTGNSPDGVFEMVNDKMTAMSTAVDDQGRPKFPITSVGDAVKLANLAFESVMRSMGKAVPRVNGSRKPPVMSSRSSTSKAVNKDPLKADTFEEAIRLESIASTSRHSNGRR